MESFLLKIPAVSGFRFNGAETDKSILVMVTTADATVRLPKRFRGYTLEPVVTGEIRAY